MGRVGVVMPLLITVALSLGGCAESGSSCPRLPGGGRYCLQGTSLVERFEVQQRVTVTFDGKPQSMIATVEVDASQMRFAALTPFGQKLVQASYDNRNVSAEQIPDKRLDPALLLAVFQIALWPESAVRSGLSENLSLVEAERERRVAFADKTLVDVRYTVGRTTVGELDIALPQAGVELHIAPFDDLELK
ncbi:DUF3261 domain-containing protein [Propionivibrio soli]|uniref:DUF3261 domain-containing protein n=1 Tax=Propionivibrio soli TaxID=2976531 RepID=UPI0021E78AD0|nr:DUF3261 domain-containing protein [Propionivibrio soli]